MSNGYPIDAILVIGLLACAVFAVLGIFKPRMGEIKLLRTALIAGSVVFGLLLLRECYLLLADGTPMPDRAYQVIRMTVGLAAGFIATGLAGSFDISGELPNATIKAGGPIGVAVFFYLVNPMDFSAEA